MLEKNTIQTDFKNQMVDITRTVEEFVAHSKVQNGGCIVFVPYIDASLLITAVDDPLIQQDITDDLTRIFPSRAEYKYSGSLVKGAAHSKGSVVGMSINLIIDNHHLVLSELQGVFLLEGVGSQSREYYIKIFGR